MQTPIESGSPVYQSRKAAKGQLNDGIADTFV